MAQAALGALVGVSQSAQQAPPLGRGAANAAFVGNPVGHLRRGPGALALLKQFPDGGQDRFGDSRGLAGVGAVGQGVEACAQIGFDPKARRLGMDLQMGSNPGNGPSHIGQAHHLQSFSQAQAHIGLARAPSQFQTGGLIKMNFVHGVGNLHTYVREYYALRLSTSRHKFAEAIT